MGYFQPLVIYRNSKEKKDASVLRYIGNRVLNNNKNFLCAVVGCLSGETKLYGQDKTLEELYKENKRTINTYSLTKVKDKCGTYYPIKSKSNITYSGKKEVYEIELENGKKVIATADHTFFKVGKHSFDEEPVSELKVGDKIRDVNPELIKNFFDKANGFSYKRNDKSYNKNKSKICIRCGNLLFIERGMGKSSKKYCKTCLSSFNTGYRLSKNHEDKWYEWEDNILRNFYVTYKKRDLLNILPNRNWSGIMHRAKRLGLTNKERRRIYNFSISQMTSIEKKVADILKRNNIDYKFNQYLKNDKRKFFPDFTIGNLIIECDGYHWHKEIKKDDEERQRQLEEMGYIVLRFDEDMINKNILEVERCIVQRLNQLKN